MNQTTRPVDAKGAAEILGRIIHTDGRPIGKRTLWRWCATGGLPRMKIGGMTRFDPEAITAWANAKREGVFL